MRAKPSRYELALLVSMVLLILSTVIVAQSIHDAQSSGYDRQRLTSVGAAESGGNYYYAYLQSTPVTSVVIGPPDFPCLDLSFRVRSGLASSQVFPWSRLRIRICEAW